MGLVALTLAPAVLVLGGVTAAWPLFVVPIVLAAPMAGNTALLAVASGAGAVTVVASGRPGVDAPAMMVGLLAFALAGGVVGVGHAHHLRARERAHSMSFADRLTAVGNEDFFHHALERECTRALRDNRSLSLLLLDLDHFGEFNRLHGVVAGNRLLGVVGETIRQVVPVTDTAARIGGETFAVIVAGPAEQAHALGEEIRLAVSNLSVPAPRGRHARATISGGVATVETADDAAGTTLSERAQLALDSAKACGRDRVVIFVPEHRWVAAA